LRIEIGRDQAGAMLEQSRRVHSYGLRQLSSGVANFGGLHSSEIIHGSVTLPFPLEDTVTLSR